MRAVLRPKIYFLLHPSISLTHHPSLLLLNKTTDQQLVLINQVARVTE
jgi:hypothetical protein